MEILRSIEDMRARFDQTHRAGQTCALVPTMGALHEGHLALVRRAREEATHVTVSVFVNPTQFGQDEDFGTYPRNLERDCELLRAQGGVDVVFAPEVHEFYPSGDQSQRVWVDSPEMSTVLCGRHRPGHFRGVLTVVAKLFAVCRPNVAVFGLKDVQQYYMIRRMVRDLALATKIIGVHTVRESDGLAVSSRNSYLSKEQRTQAPVLYRAVIQAKQLMENGECDAQAVEAAMNHILDQAPLANKQYAEVVTAGTLEPVSRLEPGLEVVAGVAVFFGRTRLIDNEIIQIPQ